MTSTASTPQSVTDIPAPAGWIVLGFNSHAMVPAPMKVVVVARTAALAMLEAAAKNPGFEPAGAMSEHEILDDLALIKAHRESLAQAV